MYGIVNLAIEELLINQYGMDVWNAVKKKSGVKVDFFVSNEAYDDEITYKLATAAASVLEVDVASVLISFGEWWILHTCKEKYGVMLMSGGDNLKSFLLYLPKFHDRAYLIYPKLSPPEFKVVEINENTLLVHYFSKREGLQDFVRGLLIGLSKLYNEPIKIEMIESRISNSDHETYKVSWT